MLNSRKSWRIPAVFDRHVFLTGMAGCGKSSLGSRTACRMQMPYLDMDEALVKQFQLTVPEIFSRYGEEAFRKAETNLLIWLGSQHPMLVSTGGGCVMKPWNQQLMRSSGLIVLIDRPLDDILKDIRLEDRPLLARNGAEGVRKMYQDRISVYRSTADIIFPNTDTLETSVQRLEQVLRQRFGLYRDGE